MRINPVYAWTLVVTAAAAVVALSINVQLAFFLLLFAIVAWWTWVWPLHAVYLFIVVAPLLPMFKITQTIGTVTLVKDVIILVLFVKLFLIPLVTKRLPYRRVLLAGPLLLLTGWVALATLRAESLVLGILRARDIVLYVLLFFVVLHLPHSRAFYRQLLGWFLVSAFIVGLLGWYQFFFLPDSAVLRFDPAREVWIPRVSSVMAHPSIFGEYLVLTSVLLSVLVLNVSRYRFLYVGLCLFLVPLIYYTYSRAVWLGLVAGVGAAGLAWGWAYLRRGKTLVIPWRLAGFIAAVAVIGLVALIQFTQFGVFARSAFEPTYGSNAERLEFIARLISPLTPLPALIGAGLGDVLVQNFRSVDIDAFDIASGASRSVQLAKNVTLVDNQFLKTFIELGLVGLLIYGWIYWRLLKAAWSLVSGHRSVVSRGIGLVGFGFVVAFLSQAFFIDIWDIFPTNAAFWLLAALVSREQLKFDLTT